MTQVDFYTGSADRLRTACQLSHKAMQHGLCAVITLPDAARLEALDRLLWQYPDTAFIPHCRNGAEQAARTPVVLSLGDEAFHHHELLINLHDEAAPFYQRFERVIEIIGTDDAASGRDRYRYYRDAGCQLRHFDLAGSGAP